MPMALLLAVPGATAVAQSPQPSAVAPTSALADARQRHTATVLGDGSVLFVGGWAHGVGALTSMERYFPLTGDVVSAADVSGARYWHTATALPDSRVLVVGGVTDAAVLASAELVTPAPDAAAPSISGPVGDLAQAREGHTAIAVLGDGHVLIVGGTAVPGPVTTAELFDPVTQVFADVPSISGDRYGASAVRLGDAPDAGVLISGGGNSDIQLLYDPVSGLATTVTALPAGRSFQSGTLLQDGRVLIVGGTDADGAALATSLLWDPVTDTLAGGPDLATGPRAGTSRPSSRTVESISQEAWVRMAGR